MARLARDIDDDGLLYRRWKDKRSHAKKLGVGMSLTFDEYAGLLRDAGIKSSAIGVTGYHLARYGDVGPYAVGNCRFVPWQVNMAEQDSSRISAGLRRHYETHDGSFLGRKHSEGSKAAIGRGNAVSQLGVRNSQFGRRWVHNGIVDKKIDAAELTAHLASGWKQGRIAL